MPNVMPAKVERATRRPRLDGLTSVRFLAALHVVFFHYAMRVPGSENLPSWIRSVIDSGPSAVCFFFALSGFILAYNYIGAGGTFKGSASRFWIARLARIYPIYLFGWLIYLPLACVKISHSGLLISGLLSLSLTQSWSSWAVAWNPPGWSLSVEAVFYLLCPLVAPLLYRMSRNSAVVLCVGLWLASLGCVRIWPTESYYPALFMPCFLAGVLAARFFAEGVRIPSGLITIWAAAIILLMAFLPLKHEMDMGLLTPLFTLLIYGLAQQGVTNESILAKAMSGSTFVKLGEASYALYILHVPIWNYVMPALNYAAHRTASNNCANLYVFLVYLAIAVAASVYCFNKIEVPARKFITHLASAPQPQLAPASLDLSVAVQKAS